MGGARLVPEDRVRAVRVGLRVRVRVRVSALSQMTEYGL